MATGLEGKNGGLWCSPIANTSRPTSSACFAIVSTSRRREASLGVCPVVGSVVMSPTLKMPNCICPRVEVVVTRGTLLVHTFAYTMLNDDLPRTIPEQPPLDRSTSELPV